MENKFVINGIKLNVMSFSNKGIIILVKFRRTNLRILILFKNVEELEIKVINDNSGNILF